MTDEARWGDLRPILQDMAERIARIEQFLAQSGADGQPFGSSVFDSPGPVFDSPGQVFDSPGQVAAQARGIYPTAGPQDGGVPPNIVMLAQSGQLIQAIQQYRQLTGLGLREAKAIVEQAAVRGY